MDARTEITWQKVNTNQFKLLIFNPRLDEQNMILDEAEEFKQVHVHLYCWAWVKAERVRIGCMCMNMVLRGQHRKFEFNSYEWEIV